MDMRLGAADENFAHAEALIRETVSRERPDVAVLPETWNTGFSPQDLAACADRDGARTRAVFSALARELNVPVVALSQLSRAVEQRPDHRPMLSDLRESGAIEQDADMVMFLYRDAYYNKDSEMKNLAEVIVAKQRNGPIGTINLLWMPEYTTFKNFKPGPPV